jgi:hypothetical protein
MRDRMRARGVGRDGQRRCAAVHFDFRSDDEAVARRLLAGVRRVVLEVERAGLHRVDDREAEWGARVFLGDVDAAALDRHGVRADTRGDSRFTDQGFGSAGPFVGLLFGAELHAGEDP